MQQVTNIQALKTAINQYGELVLSKKNNNVFYMSMEEYNEKKIKNEIINKLKKSEKEIENGEGIDAEVAFKELRHKYGY